MYWFDRTSRIWINAIKGSAMKVSARTRLVGALLCLGCAAAWYSLAADPVPLPAEEGEWELTAVALAPLPDQGEETIDPRTGRLALTATDVVLAAGPLSLDVKRAWQNVPAAPGLLGSRWRLNWECRLERRANQALIEDWRGSVTFSRDAASGTYQSPSGDRLVLAADLAIRTLPDGTRETFDVHGRLTERRLPVGHKITLTYDDLGRLTKVSGPYDSWLRFTSNDEGRLTRIEASTGAVVRYRYGQQSPGSNPNGDYLVLGYGYDGDGNLAHLDHPSRGRTQFRYSGGRVVSRVWADGSKEQFAYDESGRCRRHVDGAGRATTIAWKNDRHMQVTDALGQKTSAESDAAGRPVHISGPSGQSVRMTYDQRGRLVSINKSLEGNTRLEYLADTDLPVKVMAADGTTQSFAYDARRNLVRITAGDVEAASFVYDEGGLVTRMKTSQGQELKFGYDKQGRRQSVTDAAGKTSRFEYDRHGNRVREINPLGGVTQWTYDTAGRLVRRTDPTGATSRFEYFPSGLLSRRTGPAGGVTRYEYDARGRLTAEIDPDGRSRRYEHGSEGIKRIVGAAGTIARLEYGRDGKLANWTNPLGGITRADHDAAGHLIRLTDPAGGVTSYEHSPAGLVTKRIDSAGTVTRYDYDSRRRLVAVTNPAGQVTRYDYSPHGHLARIVPARGPVTAYEYNQAGKVSRVVGRQGELVRYEYDVLGRRVQEHHATGRVVSYRYDAAGNMLAWNDSLGGGGARKCDPAGRPVSMTDGSGASTHFRYDSAGRWLEVKDPRGHVKRLEYTPAGRLASVREATGDQSRIEHDADGYLAKLHHAGGGVTKLVRDPMGNPIRVTNPLGQETLRTYDLAGRLLSVTDAKGQTTSFAYDSASRLVEKRTADGARVSYRYDSQGNRSAVDDGKFPVLFSYDKRNQLTRIEYPAVKRVLRYEYNDAGQRTKLVDSEGRNIGYEYDATGRLSTITLDQVKAAVFAYDAKGRRTSLTYANGIKGAWEYDGSDRTTRLTYVRADGEVVAGWFYSYDQAGNCLKTTEVSGNTSRYDYDPAGQLLEEDHGAGKSVKYSYLPGGNRGRRAGTDESIAYRYDKADRLLAAGQETFHHDANGNLSERHGPAGVMRYAYDAENRLVKVVAPDGAEVAFGYAPTGERIWRRDAKGLTYFVHDGLALIAELDQELNPKATYLHGAGIDQPVLMDRAGQQYYYHAGRLGSIHSMTDAKGQQVAAYDYDAFGNVRQQDASIANPFGYTAREYDQATGLYYYRARYYDARLGRFLSVDPMPPRLLRPLTSNPYLYVRNNPVNLIDPLGLSDSAWSSVPPSYTPVRLDDYPWGRSWQGRSTAEKLQHLQDHLEYLTRENASDYEAEISHPTNNPVDRYGVPYGDHPEVAESMSANRELQIRQVRYEMMRLQNESAGGSGNGGGDSGGGGSGSGSGGAAGSPRRPTLTGDGPSGNNQTGAPNRPTAPPAPDMPAANWVEPDAPTSNGKLPRLTAREGGTGGINAPEGGGNYFQENGPRIAGALTMADLVVQVANGGSPTDVARGVGSGLAAATVLETLPAAVSGPISVALLVPAAVRVFDAGARGWGQVFTEMRQTINDRRSRDTEERARAAQQEVERNLSFEAVTALLNTEVNPLLRLKDQLVVAQAELQTMKQAVQDAAVPNPDPTFDAKRAQTLGKIQELQALIADSAGVTDPMRAKRQEAIQSLAAAQNAQRALAACANAADRNLDSLRDAEATTETFRNYLDSAVDAQRQRIENFQGAYDQNDPTVKRAFDLLFGKLRLITDVTAVDILLPLNDAKAVALRARTREQYAQRSLDELPPIPDLPEATNPPAGPDTPARQDTPTGPDMPAGTDTPTGPETPARPGGPTSGARTSGPMQPNGPVVRPQQDATAPGSSNTRTPPPVPQVSPTMVHVPNLIGRNYTEAMRRLYAPEVALRFQTNGDIRGTVRSQSPTAGTLVHKQTPVSVVFQPIMVRVPSVIGRNHSQAMTQLQAPEVGLQLRPQGDIRGTVRSQSPAAGTLVPKHTSVTVVFPPDTVRMPNLIGLNHAQATARLRTIDLDLLFRSQGDIRGTVRTQSPAAGTLVHKRSSVTATFSAPPARTPPARTPGNPGNQGSVLTRPPQAPSNPTIIAPQLVGMKFGEAKQLLISKGLLWSPGLGTAGASPTDIVSRQEPAAGAAVRTGGMVLLHVRKQRR